MQKEVIKKWLKNKYNLSFLVIFIAAIVIRLYYLSLTATQPLWWDEADYLAYAKNLAGLPVDWVVTAKHNSLYPFLVALFFKIGSSEVITKFFMQILPSILSVLLAYLIANKMYEDKRVGLIVALVMSSFWVILFNSVRFHVDIPALFTALLAIYVFWTGYEKKEKILKKIDPKWAVPLAVFLVVLTYTIRRGYFLVGLFILVYMLLTKRFSELIKDKYNWIGLLSGIALFLAENTIFSSKIGSVSQGYYHTENPINFLPLGIFKSFFVGEIWGSVLLWLFWAGLIIGAIKLFISFGYIRKSLTAKSDLFNALSIFLTLALFIFVLRTQGSFGEERWYLPLAFSSFVFIARSTTVVYDYLKKYDSKKIILCLLAIIFILGAYSQLKHADLAIRGSLESFDGIRKAGLFLNEVSAPHEEILTVPAPQVAYYAERTTIRPAQWINWTGLNEEIPQEAIFDKLRENPQVRYLVISFSERNHPLWMKQITSATRSNGEVILVAWEIPFMDTKINFINGEQNIVQSKSYDGLTFNLIAIRDEVFIYSIVRQ